jgi:hypothetical protein
VATCRCCCPTTAASAAVVQALRPRCFSRCCHSLCRLCCCCHCRHCSPHLPLVLLPLAPRPHHCRRPAADASLSVVLHSLLTHASTAAPLAAYRVNVGRDLRKSLRSTGCQPGVERFSDRWCGCTSATSSSCEECWYSKVCRAGTSPEMTTAVATVNAMLAVENGAPGRSSMVVGGKPYPGAASKYQWRDKRTLRASNLTLNQAI